MNSHNDFCLEQTEGRGRPLFRAAGFSLVELLVVIAILAILATLAGPSLVSVLQGSSLNQGGQLIQDQLIYYRQYAVVNNCTVEVRFLNFIDSDIPGDTGHYRAIQGLKVMQVINQTTGAITYSKTPISKPLRVPASVIIDAGTTQSATSLSGLLTYAAGGATGGWTNVGPTASGTSSVAQSAVAGTDPSIFKVGTTYSYLAFQIEPDGSTNLNQADAISSLYITLHQLSNGDPVAKASLPKNYFTIQVDPANGHVNTYRP